MHVVCACMCVNASVCVIAFSKIKSGRSVNQSSIARQEIRDLPTSRVFAGCSA